MQVDSASTGTVRNQAIHDTGKYLPTIGLLSGAGRLSNGSQIAQHVATVLRRAVTSAVLDSITWQQTRRDGVRLTGGMPAPLSGIDLRSGHQIAADGFTQDQRTGAPKT